MSDGFQVVGRREVGPAVWNAVADGSSDAWLWHRYQLADALATWPGVSDCSFALRDAQGEVAAIVPLRRTSSRRAKRLRYSRLDSLGGPAVAAGAGVKTRRAILAAAVDAVRGVAEGGGDVEAHVALSPLAPALRGEQAPRVNPLLSLGMSDSSTQSWVVDLGDGAEQAWRGLKDRARRLVRKAEKSGVTVREATATDLDVYYGLHLETYRRTGAEPHPRAYFEAIWSEFLSANLARILIAEVDGEPTAARNFGVFKGAAVYWTGASDERSLSNGANHLLQWRGMEWMLAEGIRFSESGEAFPGAADEKSRGLSYFKESFGGELRPLFRGRMTFPNRIHTVLDGLDLIRGAIRGSRR